MSNQGSRSRLMPAILPLIALQFVSAPSRDLCCPSCRPSRMKEEGHWMWNSGTQVAQDAMKREA